MPASLMPMPKQAFFATVNGVHGPIVGGKVYTYEAGTTTPKATYTTAAGTVANPNPVVLDARGEASVWLGSGAYDIVLKDSADAIIWTQENVERAGASVVDFLQSGAGAVGRTAQAKMREIVSADDFGAVGDGVTNDTTAIQNALNAASGKILVLSAGKVYAYSALTIKSDVTIISNGASFKRLAASTTHGVTIESGVAIDSLVITTPGGSGGDRAIRIIGSNVDIGYLSVVAEAQGAHNTANWAVEIESVPVGTTLKNIKIRSGYFKYWTCPLFIRNATFLDIRNILGEYYRTGVYLKDVTKSVFENITFQLTASSSYGAPGENGFLLERTDKGFVHDLLFSNCTVANSGEHGYRLGGAYSIQNVRFSNCRSYKSGSSIVVNNPAATEWHGGCGFKVLGGTTSAGQKHKNIFFDNCVVEDVNDQYGSFPTGHGAGNYSGFQIAVASHVYLSNCKVSKRDNTDYSSGYGMEILAADNVYITNTAIMDMYQPARLYEAGNVGAYPGWDLPCTDIYFENCVLHTSNTGLGYVLSIGDSYQNFNHARINLKHCNIQGASHALRIQPISGTGSYSDIFLDFTYTGCTANPATAADPVVYGAVAATGNIRAPWHAAAYAPTLVNGSVWQDTYGGKTYTKQGNAWDTTSKSVSVTIADNAYTTVVPPRNYGFFTISGTGTSKHMMSWYRATSAPASTKYAGASTSVVVDTTLNGTTGAAGNLTVGIQDNLLYVENRSGGSDTFVMTFL